MKQTKKGISLIVLVITIIVIVILAVAVILSLNNNNPINNAKEAVELSNRKTATEKINLKLTTIQMNKYTKEQRLPTLQELATTLINDGEVEYVKTESSYNKDEGTEVASTSKEINIGTSTSIFTKLNDFSYEFEINDSLQLASIDGVDIANNTEVADSDAIAKLTTEIENLKSENQQIKTQLNTIQDNYNNLEINIIEGFDTLYEGTDAMTEGQTYNFTFPEGKTLADYRRLYFYIDGYSTDTKCWICESLNVIDAKIESDKYNYEHTYANGNASANYFTLFWSIPNENYFKIDAINSGSYFSGVRIYKVVGVY